MQTFIQKLSLTKSIAALRFSPAARYAISLSILLLLLFYQQFRSSPFLSSFPNTDSGVFLYIGQQLLQGKVPYLDAWDHKAPLVYFLNALGLLFGGGRATGVWVLQFVLLIIAIALCFRMLFKIFGLLPALFANLLIVMGTRKVVLVNYTESYAVSFNFFAVWAYWQYTQNRKKRYLFAVGLASACSFLLRPNMIGIFLGIGLAVLICSERNWRKLYQPVLFMISGFLTPLIIISAYFLANDAFSQFIDAAFIFNRYYSSYSIEDTLSTMLYGYQELWNAGIILPAFAGLVCVPLFIKKSDKVYPLIVAMSFGLPIEMFLSSISGYQFVHYFANWLVPLGTLAGYFATLILNYSNQTKLQIGSVKLTATAGAIILVSYIFVASISYLADNSVRWVWRSRDDTVDTRTEIIQWVSSNTNADDYLLVWGMVGPSMNFSTNLPAPTRFAFQFPLFVKGYQSDALIDEFVADLTHNKPMIILDAYPVGSDFFPPINRRAREEWLKTHDTMLPATEKIFSFIDANYEPLGPIGIRAWDAYRLRITP